MDAPYHYKILKREPRNPDILTINKAKAAKYGEQTDDGRESTDKGGDEKTEDEEHYGPILASGVWHGSKKSEHEADAPFDDGYMKDGGPQRKKK